MKIFAAGLQTETNTFAPWPTGASGFVEGGTCRGDYVLRGTGPDHATARLWRDLAERDGHSLFVSLFANAKPSGPTVQGVYEGFRDEILSDLSSHGPFDMLLLFLHGAMVSTECDDCEGDLLQHVRALVGPDVVIGVELDPHCHLTSSMIEQSDVVIIMKLYPHDDYLPRAHELYDVCLAAREGRARPVSAMFDCRMVGFFRTTLQPMAGLVDRFAAIERQPGILSVSFAHGFPWGDTPDTGSRVLVIADGDADLAAKVASDLGREIHGLRNALLPRLTSVEDALDEAERTPGLVVLADTADNAGAGAASDRVTLLRAMLERRTGNAAFGAVWDPVVVGVCKDAGVGARLNLRLGGKAGVASGDPIDVQGTVIAYREAHDQPGLGESRAPLGPAVWIDIDGISVVVTTLRDQVFAPELFTGMGIDLTTMKMVVVKSMQHFQTRFAPIASKIIWLASPRTSEMNFKNIAYVKKA